MRAGFSLAETIVAVAVLSIGALGATAAGSLAARRLAHAEAREQAVRHAAAVLDSLAALPTVAAGARLRGRHRIDWTVTGGVIDAVVTYHDGTAERRVRFLVRHAPVPPRLDPADR